MRVVIEQHPVSWILRQLAGDRYAEGLASAPDIAVGQLRPKKSHPQFMQISIKLFAETGELMAMASQTMILRVRDQKP